MTLLDAQDDKEYLNGVISRLISHTENEAMDLNKRGMLADGTLFLVNEDRTDGAHWKVATIVKGHFIFVDYEIGVYTNARLEVLKRKGIARLLNIAETKWVPTAKMPYIPQRYENLDTSKVLFTAEAIENSLEDARHDNEVIDPEFGKETKEGEEYADDIPVVEEQAFVGSDN